MVSLGPTGHTADFTYAGMEFHIINNTNTTLTLNTTKRIYAFAISGITGTNTNGYGYGSLTGNTLSNQTYSLSQDRNVVLYNSSTTSVLRTAPGTSSFDLQARFPDLGNLNSRHTPQATLILYMAPLKSTPSNSFTHGNGVFVSSVTSSDPPILTFFEPTVRSSPSYRDTAYGNTRNGIDFRMRITSSIGFQFFTFKVIIVNYPGTNSYDVWGPGSYSYQKGINFNSINEGILFYEGNIRLITDRNFLADLNNPNGYIYVIAYYREQIYQISPVMWVGTLSRSIQRVDANGRTANTTFTEVT
jgi:hypothetical protein